MANFNGGDAYVRRLFSEGAIPRVRRTLPERNINGDQYALGGPAYDGRLPSTALFNNWPAAARIGLNWGLFADLHRHNLERGDLRRVRLASETAGDLRRRFVQACEGKHQVPRVIISDRMFAENLTDVHFLAACAEYVAHASELPASTGRWSTVSCMVGRTLCR